MPRHEKQNVNTPLFIAGMKRYPFNWQQNGLACRPSKCMKEIAISSEFEIEEMKIAQDHVHIGLGFPPNYSIPKGVERRQEANERAVFQRYPEVKREL